MTRIASIKETGEELSSEQWRRFEAAVGVKVSYDRRRASRSAFGGQCGYYSSGAAKPKLATG